jgi:hypothetical protein
MEPGGSARGGGDGWLRERSPELAALERSAAAVQSSLASQADGELAKIVGAGAAPADLLAALAADPRSVRG